MERIRKIENIYSKLEDDISRNIFQARLQYVFDNENYQKKDNLCDSLWDNSVRENARNRIIEQWFETHSKEKVVIFGAGKYGLKAKYLLETFFGVTVKAFGDNDIKKQGDFIDGIRCVSLEEIGLYYRDYTVIPISTLYWKEMIYQLMNVQFPIENMLIINNGFISVAVGKQYFDFEKIVPRKNGIFIDAGAFNGNTTQEYIEWSGNDFKKIYALEPNQLIYNCYLKEKKIDSRVNNINVASWDKEEKLQFVNNSSGSIIVENNGNTEVQGVPIDKIVGDDIVTFIKMDVEGAEYQSLIGAKNTIQKNKPDLAICIYHKQMDFIDLPSLILEMVPEYKIAFRHYTNYECETILYAYIEQ